MKTNQKYVKELKRQLGYFATWLPGTPLALGDIGVFKQNVFTKIGNLSDKGIAFDIERDTTQSDIEHHSSGEVSITIKAAGQTVEGSQLPSIDAGVTVNFGNKNSILFKANGTTSPSIQNQIKLGKQIVELYRKGSWDKDWAVITELVHSTSSSIIISNESGGKIDLKVKGDIGANNIDIADADANFELVFAKGLSTKIIAEKGLTPLFKVSKVKSHIFSKPSFELKGVRGMDLMTPEEAQKNEEAVYFGEADFEDSID